MSKISYENFGRLARGGKEIFDATLLSGRLAEQKKSERYIFQDIINKLQITPSDCVLDIGSGPGSISIPLSFACKEVTALDHPDVLEKLKNKCSGMSNIQFHDGNFLETELVEKYDKVIVYSVLHYLEDSHEVVEFILKAISMLKRDGAALFGDIPNTSKKKRFSESSFGKSFIRERNLMEPIFDDKDIVADSNYHFVAESFNFEKDKKMVVFDDAMVLSLINKIRLKGFHAYVLPQSPNLPFGHTREDILVLHPEGGR